MHKFYEHVRWSHLRAAAVQFQFPVMLLRAPCVVYSGSRRILCGRAVSASLFATGSVVAGCSAATTLAKLLLLGPLRSTLQNRPQLALRNVVDDVELQALGNVAMVDTQMGQGVSQLLREMQQLDLPISLKKCKYMASSTELACRLGQQ